MADEIKVTTEQLLGIKKIKKVTRDEDVTMEMLEKNHKTAAFIVKKYGVIYLPIFERIEREIEKRKASDELYKRALQIAESN